MRVACFVSGAVFLESHSSLCWSSRVCWSSWSRIPRWSLGPWRALAVGVGWLRGWRVVPGRATITPHSLTPEDQKAATNPSYQLT